MARPYGVDLGLAVTAGVICGAVAGRMTAWQCTDSSFKVCRAGYWSWPWFVGVFVLVACEVTWGALRRLRG